MGSGLAGLTGNDARDVPIVREPRPEIGWIDQYVEPRHVRRCGNVLHLNRTSPSVSRRMKTPQATRAILVATHADAGRYCAMHWLLMATVYTHSRPGQHRPRIPTHLRAEGRSAPCPRGFTSVPGAKADPPELRYVSRPFPKTAGMAPRRPRFPVTAARTDDGGPIRNQGPRAGSIFAGPSRDYIEPHRINNGLRKRRFRYGEAQIQAEIPNAPGRGVTPIEMPRPPVPAPAARACASRPSDNPTATHPSSPPDGTE